MSVKEIAMPVSELCDRLTIAQLKLERLSDDEINKKELQKQIEYYESGVDMDRPRLVSLVIDLHKINGQMWDAEYAIRKGLDNDLGLEEIGRRALKIRDLNRVRVSVKNEITEIVGQPEFKDCKMNHASS
tara:strand:+ start:27819 stop:28208 length:390 start_codon:yes stop_codon:yes gene_type:complete